MFKCSPSQIFLQKKNLTKTVFFFSGGSSFSHFFYSLPFAKSIVANKYLLNYLFFSFDLSYEKNSSVFWKWISLLYSRFSHLFSSLFVFVHHVSLSPFFSFPFMFDLISSFGQHFHLPFVSKKLFNLSLFHACVTSVCLFFLFVFSRFSHICFPFPFVFSVQTSLKKSLWNCCESEKMFVCFPIPFCWALVSHSFVFACLSLFRNFTFLIYSNLFLNNCLFCSRSWMFLPLLLPFYVSLFWDSVWFDHRFSHLFYFLLLHIFSHKDMFLYCLNLYSLSFFWKKSVSCLLVLSKVSTCPLCFLLFSLFNLLLLNASFFFQNKNSVGKTSCVLVYRSLFSFSFICFSCRFLVVFFLISFATCFLLKNDLCNSLFPPFVHPLSICSLSSLINFFCTLLSPCFFTSNSLCNKKVIFLASAKKSVSFVGLHKKINLFFLCLVFLCLEKWFLILYISPLFFASSFEHCFSFLHSFFRSIKKTLFLLENGAKTVFCFLFLFSWFQKHVVSEKNRSIFPLFLICCLNSSLSSLKTTENSAKKSSCFVSVPSLFLFHLFSFNIFPYFLSSLFSLFTFSFHPFVHPFLLFSPFSFLSLFLHLMFPCSFFLHRRFCVSSFCLTSLFFSLSFVLDLIFLFTLLLYHVLLHLRICFWPKKFKNFCGQFFLMKFCLCFLNSPFFGVSSLVFSPLRRPHSLFVQCFTHNERFLTLLILIFFYQFSFWTP